MAVILILYFLPNIGIITTYLLMKGDFMKLLNLLSKIDHKILQGNTDIEISDIIYDSRKVTPNTLFVQKRNSYELSKK